MIPCISVPGLFRRLTVILLIGVLVAMVRTAWASEPITIVALGDSLTAGYGLSESESFPVKLEAALRSRSYDVSVVNAGVSGDTVEEGLARLDWSVPDGTDAVIVELGANNALRGMDPSAAKAALDQIVGRLRARDIEVLIAGMEAASSLGQDYVESFRAMFPEIAAKHGALLYPFFLDGVAIDPALNQPDGLHPTGKGVDVIVGRILPEVEALIARVAAKKGR
jgi:acyl-CoA thioesterase-1